MVKSSLSLRMTRRGALVSVLLMGLLSHGVAKSAATDAASGNGSWPNFGADPLSGTPNPPVIAARAFLLLDLSCTQTLAARQADLPIAPASLTKLMSAWLIFSALRDGGLKLDQTVTISDVAAQAGMANGMGGWLKAGTHAKVEDLLRSMAVLNANDATVALAEAVAGSADEFVGRMNRQAEVFGLKNTKYRNADGQAIAGHRSSARDMAIVAAHLLTDFPEALTYYATKSVHVGGSVLANRNLLLTRDPSVDGLQTGFADQSGFSIAATAKRVLASGERRLVAVVLGAASPEARADEAQKLLNWGYSAFDAVRLFDAKEVVTTAAVWKGRVSTVRLGRNVPISVAVPSGQGANLQTSVTRQEPLVAPIRVGQLLGRLNVSLSGQPWQTLPLQSLDDVPSAGWAGRTWDAIRLGIQ